MPVLIEVRLGIDGAWRSIITGEVDAVDIDWTRRVLQIEGRDLSARLIAARTQESFQNRTSSEIAQILAARHGLSAEVTPTSTIVGRYYQIEKDRVTLNQFSRLTTEWDLLTFLARQEGFEVYVEGMTLHFEPFNLGMNEIVLIDVGDLLQLRTERILTLGGEVSVTVKSWNSRRQCAFVETASSAGTSGAPARQYVVVRPNLTAQEAAALARRLLSELSQHEKCLAFTMPGELSLSPRNLVMLSGTGTEFDQTYRVIEVERFISMERGFMQRVRATSGLQSAST